MRKNNYVKKRMLALALSVSMLFASTDTYVALAEESVNLGGAIIEESDTVTVSDITGVTDPVNDSVATDEIDSTSQPNAADETNPSNDSNAAGENGSSNDPDTVEDSDPASDSDQVKDDNEANKSEGEADLIGDSEGGGGSELPPESQSGEAVEGSSNETIPEAGDASYAENADDAADSGVENNITWNINTRGRLFISGTGDYEVDDDGNPPWADRAEEIKYAIVNVSGITSTKRMFYNCSNMTSVEFYWYESNVTDMRAMFSGCSSLTDLDLSEFNTSNVTQMDSMFSSCSSLRSLDLSNFDTSNVTDMSAMFSGCSSLTDLDLSEFNTGNVTQMDSMFSSCSSLGSLDLSNFDTSNVTDMSSMFSGCSGLTDLDLGKFNTGNVTQMNSMLSSCSSLGSLDLSNFDTGNVTDMSGMFSQCTGLSDLDLSSFDMQNVTTGFDLSGCDSLISISVPKNIPEDIDISLPTGKNRTDKWYDKDGNTYTKLPTGLTDSITLYKNAFIKDESGTLKTVLKISGITIGNKTYDGMPNEFTGTAVAKDVAGNIITDVIIDYYYEGTLINGNGIGKTVEAPTQAGQYRLVFTIEENDKYILEKTTYYSFYINRKTVTIIAPTVSIEVGEKLPLISEMSYKVKDLLENDTFITEPQLKYGAENISTSKTGSYEIIPYGADAGNNYSIKYANGTLFVEEIVEKGTTNNISWHISKDGRLTITGTGDYEVDEYGNPPWAGRTGVISVVVNVSDITSTRHMFIGVGQSSATGYWVGSIDLSNLDTSKVTDMSGMFAYLQLIGGGTLDLSSFDTSNVTDMSDMFYGGTSNINLSSFNTSNVTNMSYMFAFSGGSKINLSSFDTSNVTDMSYMFYEFGHNSLSFSLDLSNFNTSKVKDMNHMFAQRLYNVNINKYGLHAVNLSSFDTSEVTDMSYMFANSDIDSLDLSSFNPVKVKDMNHMFYYCHNLTDLNLSNFNTRNVTDMSYMFARSSIASLDLSSFDFRNVTNMDRMFVDKNNDGQTEPNDNLQSLDLGDFNISKITDTSHMFDRCYNLVSININSSDTSNVTNMSYMFRDCWDLTGLDLSSFDTRNVTNMGNMFYMCEKLKNLDVSNFDTRNVTNMDNMFYDCYSLESLDLSSFDTSYVKTMRYMFSGCIRLTDLDLSSFSANNLTNTKRMFGDCRNLKNLNLSSFDTSNVTNMDGMFYNCSALAVADLSSFDLSKATNMEDLFYNCTNLALICTPKNCNKDVELPIQNDTDKWYDENKKIYTTLPKSLSDSIVLYKNSYPGDGTGMTKQVLFISGITINDKVYDKTANPFIGTPVAKDSSGNTISDVAISYSYSGRLTDGSAYANTTDAPTQAGNYKLSFAIDGSDAYLAGSTYSFRIIPKEVTITAGSVSIEKNERLPALSELKYTVEGLLDGDILLTSPQLKYSAEDISSSKSGRYDIIPYGAKAESSYRIKYVNGKLIIGDPDDDSTYEDDDRIDLKSISGSVVKINAKTYNASPWEPAVKVTVIENNKKKTLTEGHDYRVLYEDNTAAGTAAVIVRGNGIYKGELRQPFTINPKSIKKTKIVAGSMVVGDDASKPPIYIYDGAKLLKEGVDYTLSGTSGMTAQAAKSVKVTVTGIGNYNKTATAKIAVYDSEGTDTASNIINPLNVTLPHDEMPYTGKAIKDNDPIVQIGGTILIKNKDYKVQYTNNTNSGTAFVIVTGKGAYKGKVVTSFEIVPSGQKLEIKEIKAKTYNGKLQKPAITVTAKDTGKRLTKNKDYTVIYTNNLHAGTGTVTVIGKGNYAGRGEQTFDIGQQKISKVSVKGTQTGGLTVTYSNRVLKEGTDYTLEYGEVIKNKVKVTISAKEGSNFTGSVVKSVKIQ